MLEDTAPGFAGRFGVNQRVLRTLKDLHVVGLRLTVIRSVQPFRCQRDKYMERKMA